MRCVRRLLRLRRLAALSAVLALTWVFAPGARADGPTSVLVVSPESARTASLNSSGADYRTLSDLLAAPAGESPSRPLSLDAAMEARQINATWMIHDAQPWRLDEVYARPDRAPVWIRTSQDVPYFASGTWHRAGQPQQLKALLKKLGMMGEPPADGPSSVLPSDDDAASAPAGEQPANATRPPDLALITATGSGHSGTLTTKDGDFTRLSQLLNPQSTDTERAPAGPAPQVRASVVWGLSGVGGWPQTRAAPGGDIAIEREDQVMVGDDSTVWVRSDPAVDVNDDDLRWHRVPAEVLDLLAKHKLLGPAEAAGAGQPTTAGWWWALPGLAVGAAAGYGGALLGRRRETELPEPRQQLIDLDT